MFDSFYEFLSEIGYGHPVHPPFVHAAAGVPTAAFVVMVAALLASTLSTRL
jgi:hypothetical protein